MKIIITDYEIPRIIVLSVPDSMIENDVEQFLTDLGYSLDEISWMTTPADSVPVISHKYNKGNWQLISEISV